MKRTAGALAVVAALAIAAPARAENQVSVRGVYYREPSTRVVQPVVEVRADLPANVDVTAHYLLDAITSASAASGPSGDNIFTEYRNEAGLQAGWSWSWGRVGGGYKYSAESDYWSHTLVGSLSLRLWGDSANVVLLTGLGFDHVGRRVQGNAPGMGGGPTCMPGPVTSCPLDTKFGGIVYSQVLSPTVLVQTSYEFAYLAGYLGSPYRPEIVPDTRWRNAVSARVAKYFPTTGSGIQLHYRYYWDLGDWQISSHTIEARFYQRIGRDLELRLTARHYPQGPAAFWCDTTQNPGCYQGAQLTAASPQLGPVTTSFLEAKVYWDARPLRDVPILGWFSAGTFELSYGRLIQSTSFADAHLLQTGYTLPY